MTYIRRTVTNIISDEFFCCGNMYPYCGKMQTPIFRIWCATGTVLYVGRYKYYFPNTQITIFWSCLLLTPLFLVL
jgi:hypothetical protein